MKKVNVLLSAYNGQDYIEEQIDSILNQTYQNIEIYVRDDGSKDNTLQVLERYNDNAKIHVIKGENVGFVHSFEALIVQSGDADYYAFSDQDDVWLPDKIARAVEVLEKEDNQRPLLYFSNYDFYDGKLNFQEHHIMKEPKISFRNAIMDCITLGFNSVFNRQARELVVNHTPEHSLGHDWWMYMLCTAFGKVVYDDTVTVKYRRHDSNVSSAGVNFIQFQIWRFKKFFLNGYFKKIRIQIQEFSDIYFEQLSAEDQKLISLFTGGDSRILKAVKKVFYPRAFRQGIVDEIMVRIIFLIGRL